MLKVIPLLPFTWVGGLGIVLEGILLDIPCPTLNLLGVVCLDHVSGVDPDVIEQDD